MKIRTQVIRLCALLAGLVMGSLTAASANAQQSNPIFDSLLQKGVNFDQAGMRRLRPPTLDDGMNAKQQKAAIEGILTLKAGQPLTYNGFARFQNTGLNAPYVMVIDDPQFGQNAPGHSIDLWFVVRGTLEKVADPAFLKGQFKPDKNDKLITLTAADIANRQIKLEKLAGVRESYVYGQFRVFPTNARVLVGGTCHLMQTTAPTASILAGVVDLRFDQDPTMGNQWQPVLGVENGQLQLGNPTVYHSAGGYTKITELLDPPGVLLVEYHFVYNEPAAWFNGNDLLRPKLLAETSDNVRLFRRAVLLGKK